MTRYKQWGLVLALFVSMLIHFGMLWYGKLKPEPPSPEPVEYEVRMVYYTPPEGKVAVEEAGKSFPERVIIEKQPEIKEPEKEPIEEKKDEVSDKVMEENAEKVIEEKAEPDVLPPDGAPLKVEDEKEFREDSPGFTSITTEAPREGTGMNEGVTDDYSLYVKELRDRIIKEQVYPYAARKKGIQGIVVVQLLIDENGSLLEISVAESSGHKLLDRAALMLVKKVLPFKHNAGRPLNVEIPIKYSFVN